MCVRFVIYQKTGWVISLEAGSDWNGPCLRVSGRDNSVTGRVSLAQLDKRPVASRRAALQIIGPAEITPPFIPILLSVLAFTSLSVKINIL